MECWVGRKGIGSKLDDRRNIHHRGTEVAEFGVIFLIQQSLLCALRASAVQSPSPASNGSLKTQFDCRGFTGSQWPTSAVTKAGTFVSKLSRSPLKGWAKVPGPPIRLRYKQLQIISNSQPLFPSKR